MIPALQLEVKKDGWQQLQSGSYKLTVTLNPADFKGNEESLLLDFIRAPMGQRYMIGMAKIGEDEQPEKPKREPAQSRAELARRLCGVPAFQDWMRNRFGPANISGDCYLMTSDWVKLACDVESKSELDPPDGNATGYAPAEAWDKLVSEFRQATGKEAEQR